LSASDLRAATKRAPAASAKCLGTSACGHGESIAASFPSGDGRDGVVHVQWPPSADRRKIAEARLVGIAADLRRAVTNADVPPVRWDGALAPEVWPQPPLRADRGSVT